MKFIFLSIIFIIFFFRIQSLNLRQEQNSALKNLIANLENLQSQKNYSGILPSLENFVNQAEIIANHTATANKIRFSFPSSNEPILDTETQQIKQMAKEQQLPSNALLNFINSNKGSQDIDQPDNLVNDTQNFQKFDETDQKKINSKEIVVKSSKNDDNAFLNLARGYQDDIEKPVNIENELKAKQQQEINAKQQQNNGAGNQINGLSLPTPTQGQVFDSFNAYNSQNVNTVENTSKPLKTSSLQTNQPQQQQQQQNQQLQNQKPQIIQTRNSNDNISQKHKLDFQEPEMVPSVSDYAKKDLFYAQNPHLKKRTLLIGKKSYTDENGRTYDDKPLIVNTIVKTTETESVTSYSDITEENINLWKDLKDPHMKDVQYGAAPKPEILIIPGANRSGEFELLGRTISKPVLTRDASDPLAPHVFDQQTGALITPTSIVNDNIQVTNPIKSRSFDSEINRQVVLNEVPQ